MIPNFVEVSLAPPAASAGRTINIDLKDTVKTKSTLSKASEGTQQIY
jgi:hypothetical protein